MHQLPLFFFAFFFFNPKIHAQLTDRQIAGEYYLTGVMEVGSGFLLHEDHTFEFFFSYGALDRQGKGTWKTEADHIVLNSEPWPGSDFRLERQEHRKQKGIVIQVTDKNKMILPYVGGIISGKGKTQEMQADQEGTITFESQPVDSVSLYHQFFSDELSVFPVKGTTDNYFEFTFLPHLGTVFFHNFTLTVSKSELEGGHPLLEKDKTYHYVKSK
ncbi:MAG TPA: hypothetical protein PLD84_10940 [Chitinophagales bacterium]|nr:hypothetical protein [Chitinophagales bacterium]